MDKSGQPYIGHPARVAARTRDQGDGNQVEAVAWLHDVVEDTEVTLADVESAFGVEIAQAVDAMTRRPDEEPDRYYARVADNPIALRVKRADIADNLDPERTARLDPATKARLAAKYEHAWPSSPGGAPSRAVPLVRRTTPLRGRCEILRFTPRGGRIVASSSGVPLAARAVAIRDLVLVDQRHLNDICWAVFAC